MHPIVRMLLDNKVINSAIKILNTEYLWVPLKCTLSLFLQHVYNITDASIFFRLHKLLVVAIHFKQWHFKQTCPKQQGFFTFPENTPWLLKAIPFPLVICLQWGWDLSEEKVGGGKMQRRHLTLCFNSASGRVHTSSTFSLAASLSPCPVKSLLVDTQWCPRGKL